MIAPIFRTREPALWSDMANISHVLEFTITHHIANILDKKFLLRIVVYTFFIVVHEYMSVQNAKLAYIECYMKIYMYA